MTEPKVGSIDMVFGPMFSGKSTRAQQDIRRYLSAHLRVVALKPKQDTRGRSGIISSHDGVEFPARDVQKVKGFELLVTANPSDALDYMETADVFVFEETQFWGEEVLAVLGKLRRMGKIVKVFMLDLTFKRELWPTFAAIFQMAEKKEQLMAICPGLNGEPCGRDAAFSKALVPLDGTVNIGGQELYQSACHIHFTDDVRPDSPQFSLTKDF